MVAAFALTPGLILLSLVLGAPGHTPEIPHTSLHFWALTGMKAELGTLGSLGSTFQAHPVKMYLATAVLLSGLCVIVNHRNGRKSATVLGSTLMMLGLSLGVLLVSAPLNRIFLIGIFSYAGFSVIRAKQSTILKTVSLAQMGLAVVCILASLVVPNRIGVFPGLFLAMTLLPLIPFHLPFVSIMGSAEGILPGFYVVALLALGLSELHDLQSPMAEGKLFVIQLLALISAVYASLKCLGQNQFRSFIAYATIAQVALLWVVQQVFVDFSNWGIQFGTAVAFVMSGLCCVYTFLQQRYGSHSIGRFPGLGAPMPRLGILLMLLISIAILLPIVPTFAGLMTMPTWEHSDVPITVMLITFCAVWLFGSWYFAHLLHQTAFGEPQEDVPYSDLQATEVSTLALFIVAASYSGFVL